MQNLLRYVYGAFIKIQNGTVTEPPEPADPPDIGEALTQDDIDFVKRLRQELTRFDDYLPPDESL